MRKKIKARIICTAAAAMLAFMCSVPMSAAGKENENGDDRSGGGTAALTDISEDVLLKHIVEGETPQGTTMNLFDYWTAENREAPDNIPIYDNDSAQLNLGINNRHALIFGKNMGADGGIEKVGAWNVWTGAGNGPKKGIVKSRLGADGYPVLNPEVVKTEDTTMLNGRNAGESLGYLFDPEIRADGKKSFMDVDGLLQQDQDGYYYYTSSENPFWGENGAETGNFAEFVEETNSFRLYDTWAVINKAGTDAERGQFFPFNKGAQVFSGESGGKLVQDGTFLTNEHEELNHYFGMTMTTRFIQQYGGHTTKKENKPVKYEFSGDDDVWIFIDGVLVADLGGIHDAVDVSIDFSTGKIMIKGEEQEETLGRILGYESDTLPDNTYHTLKFFYLERGNSDSNMSLKFNLPAIPESSLVKIDQQGNPVGGAEFVLKSYEGAEIAAGTTDENGGFVFEDEYGVPLTVAALYNKYGSKGEDREYDLLLEETKVPAGYRKAGAMQLYFYETEKGDVLLLSGNHWETGAYAMPKVTATAPTRIQVEGMESPVAPDEHTLMFAVVLQKQENGSWKTIYGDPLGGWHVSDKVGTEGIKEAACANPYTFKMTRDGSFKVDIENLPGDVKNYYYVCGDEEKAEYTVAYYYTTADSLEQITDDNCWLMNDDEHDAEFQRVFSMNVYVPDVRNRLLVQKVDEEGNPVNGAEFALYKAEDISVGEDGTYTVNEGAQPYDTLVADGVTEPLTLEAGGVFPEDGTAGKLETGEYYLVETAVPGEGYELNTQAVKVVVDESGVYADAGTKGDGVKVYRGVGYLVHSMAQFAVDDNVDTTLHDIKATLQKAAGYPLPEDGSAWETTGETTHLQYSDNKDAVLQYKEANETYPLRMETDEGWSKLLIQQCLAHQTDSGIASDKQDIGETDITRLFSGTVTVQISDQRVGDLKLSKETEVPSGGEEPADTEFKFTLRYENAEKVKGNIYGAVRTGAAGNTEEINITFEEDGTAEITLRAGEAVHIRRLPYGTVTVTEAETDGYIAYVSVDGKEREKGNTGQALITEENTEEVPAEITFTNVYYPKDPEAPKDPEVPGEPEGSGNPDDSREPGDLRGGNETEENEGPGMSNSKTGDTGDMVLSTLLIMLASGAVAVGTIYRIWRKQ